MTKSVRQLDGEFWFTAAYAAKLLGTTRKKVEAMAVRDLVRCKTDGRALLIAESDVTRFRRDVEALRELKAAAAMPAQPPKGEPMPSETVYVGDAPRKTLKMRPRIGHPLKDQGGR